VSVYISMLCERKSLIFHVNITRKYTHMPVCTRIACCHTHILLVIPLKLLVIPLKLLVIFKVTCNTFESFGPYNPVTLYESVVML